MKIIESEESPPPDDPGGRGAAAADWTAMDGWAGSDERAGTDDWVDVQVLADYDLQRWADIEHDEPADPDAIPVPPDRFATERAAHIDAIIDTERRLAAAHHDRAVAIAAAQEFTERAVLPGIPITGAQWDGYEVAMRSLRAEVACALRIPEVSAGRILLESSMLVNRLPQTFAALGDGTISYKHARTVVEEIRALPDEALEDFEAAVLPRAARTTPVRFRAVARQVRERKHPWSIEKRREICLSDRSARFRPRHDGMAMLEFYQSADWAGAAYARITDLAISMQGSDETRTLTQLRSDVASELLLRGVTAEGLGTGIVATVHVTVPVFTLMGHDDEPAMLDGYGPIDAETARRLAGTATSWLRILTHPETGAVLSVGQNPEQVPADLKRFLQIRDGTCRFMGCGRPARLSEIDHTLDRQFGGQMTHDNLSHLCKMHHLLKHQTGWQLVQVKDGVLAWTAPTGHVYYTDPATPIQTPAIDTDTPPPF
ncbi:HNH endonuclease signature motif containing protein [Cryobacterium frigoriphilum]|nr:HNH endonuclease signature motif containing protein [Cryobacterium frigoriphilum]